MAHLLSSHIRNKDAAEGEEEEDDDDDDMEDDETGYSKLKMQPRFFFFTGISILFNEGDTQQSVMTNKPVALRFQIKFSLPRRRS